MALDISKLEQEHGEVRVIRTVLGEVAVRTPSRGDWNLFRQAIMSESKRYIALENLARASVVYPSKEQFSTMLDKKPAIAELVGKAAEELAGGSEVEEAKKD